MDGCLAELREIWKQNTVVAPADRVATIAAILKGDSLTAFEAALEDARVDNEPEDKDDPSHGDDAGARRDFSPCSHHCALCSPFRRWKHKNSGLINP